LPAFVTATRSTSRIETCSGQQPQDVAARNQRLLGARKAEQGDLVQLERGMEERAI
jgi:hypothetical protein